MTKQELIERVYRKRGAQTGLTYYASTDIVDGVLPELGEYFVKTKVTKSSRPNFTSPRFGTLAKKRRQARTGRHPQTGQAIEITAKNTVAFTLGSELKAL